MSEYQTAVSTFISFHCDEKQTLNQMLACLLFLIFQWCAVKRNIFKKITNKRVKTPCLKQNIQHAVKILACRWSNFFLFKHIIVHFIKCIVLSHVRLHKNKLFYVLLSKNYFHSHSLFFSLVPSPYFPSFFMFACMLYATH